MALVSSARLRLEARERQGYLRRRRWTCFALCCWLYCAPGAFAGNCRCNGFAFVIIVRIDRVAGEWVVCWAYVMFVQGVCLLQSREASGQVIEVTPRARATPQPAEPHPSSLASNITLPITTPPLHLQQRPRRQLPPVPFLFPNDTAFTSNTAKMVLEATMIVYAIPHVHPSSYTDTGPASTTARAAETETTYHRDGKPK